MRVLGSRAELSVSAILTASAGMVLIVVRYLYRFGLRQRWQPESPITRGACPNSWRCKMNLLCLDRSFCEPSTAPWKSAAQVAANGNCFQSSPLEVRVTVRRREGGTANADRAIANHSDNQEHGEGHKNSALPSRYAVLTPRGTFAARRRLFEAPSRKRRSQKLPATTRRDCLGESNAVVPSRRSAADPKGLTKYGCGAQDVAALVGIGAARLGK